MMLDDCFQILGDLALENLRLCLIQKVYLVLNGLNLEADFVILTNLVPERCLRRTQASRHSFLYAIPVQ